MSTPPDTSMSTASTPPPDTPVSTTSLSTSTASECSTPTCPTGIARAQYPQPFGGTGGYNERFNTSYYKETKPDSVNTVTTFSDIGDAGENEISYEYATFVYSCQEGRFFFNITNADDIALAWFGGVACGDFEKSNNQSSSSYEGGPGEGKSFTAQLEPEQYYPIRVIFANSGGPASLDLDVIGPEGSVEGDNAYGYYPAPCDNSNSFTDFGSEAQEGRSCANP